MRDVVGMNWRGQRGLGLVSGRRRLRVWLGLLGAGWLAVVTAAARADDAPQYNRDVRPILAENCFACHGPDSAARKAELRLDQRRGGDRTVGDHRRASRRRAAHGSASTRPTATR